MPIKYHDFAEKLSIVFSRMNKKIEKIHCGLLENSSVNRAQIKILANINREGKKKMTEIGDMLMVPKSNVTPLIDELIKMELIRRTFDNNDRRIIFINLTDKGKEFIGKYRIRYYSILKEKLKDLNASDYMKIEYVLELLDKIFN